MIKKFIGLFKMTAQQRHFLSLIEKHIHEGNYKIYKRFSHYGWKGVYEARYLNIGFMIRNFNNKNQILEIVIDNESGSEVELYSLINGIDVSQLMTRKVKSLIRDTFNQEQSKLKEKSQNEISSAITQALR